MSIHVTVCKICQRSISGDESGCTHCTPLNQCGCCGTELKAAMLRCRECGTATKRPSQRNSAKNGNSKTVTAARVFKATAMGKATTVPKETTQPSGPPGRHTCVNCKELLRPGMLRCRSCGHAVDEEVNAANSNQNSEGRQSATKTKTNRLSKATTGQPIPPKPSHARQSRPLDSVHISPKLAGARTLSNVSMAANAMVEPLAGGWAGIAQTTPAASAQQQHEHEIKIEKQPRISSNESRTPREKTLQPKQATKIVDDNAGNSPKTNNRQSESTNAPKQNFLKTARPKNPPFSINWRLAGIVGGTLVGILLGAVFVRRASEGTTNVPVNDSTERQAAVWVVQHFGVVTVKTADDEERRYVAEEHLPNAPFVVTEINLYDQELDESELSFLPRLSGLTKLDLSRTASSATAMKYAGAVPTLKALYLRGNQCPADLFKYLKHGDQYENISVSGARGFDDAAISALTEQMPNLKVFSCTSTDVSSEGATALVTLQSLKSLTAAKNNWSQDAIDNLTKALPKCRIKL